MKVTCRLSRDEDIELYQIKVWVDRVYRDGCGFVENACHAVYIDSITPTESALRSVWAEFVKEFGYRDENGGFLYPFDRDTFTAAAAKTL
jgi:hypothetical protein